MSRIKPAGLAVIISIISILLVGVSCNAPEEANVYASPSCHDISHGQALSVDIKVEPLAYGISGGEINLSFDPTAMKVTGYEAGDLLGATPLVGLESLDNNEGMIKYALARSGDTMAPTPAGVFMVVNFEVLATAETGTYHLDLVSVGLADEEFQEIKQLNLQDATVEIK